MNSKAVGRLVVRAFPTVPSRANIPDPQRQWHGGKAITWEVNGVKIRTYPHTMGRIFAKAVSPQFPDEYVEVYASNHKAAVRALARYCHTFFAQ